MLPKVLVVPSRVGASQEFFANNLSFKMAQKNALKKSDT
jgi:hypothetical protein